MLLRPAVPSDVEALADLHVRARQVAYRGLLPDPYLDGLRPDEAAQRCVYCRPDHSSPWTIVAVEGGAIRGFVMTRPAQDADAIGWGEVLSVYLDPAFVGQGLGPKLLEAGRMRLASQGCRRAIGWIFEANAHIQRVVIRDGWAHDGARVMSEIGGARVPAIRFARQLP